MLTIKTINNGTATINIDGDGTTYAWTVGGLDDVADVQAHLDANADTYRRHIRTHLAMGLPVDVVVRPTLAETVAARTTEAAAACSAVLAPLRARFAEGEELTWQAQLAEANALLSNPALVVVPEPGTEEAKTWVDPIPTIRGIVAITGEDIGAFSEAVRRNNETWTAVTAYCIGQRQRFVATIKAVAAAEGATVADVLAVPLEIALPG